jgi:putative membrane protein
VEQFRAPRESTPIVDPQSFVDPQSLIAPVNQQPSVALRTSVRMGALKHVGIVVWCVGIAACIALSLWTGLDEVASAVASVGWGMLGVVLARAATVSIAGAGWWLLFPRGPSLEEPCPAEPIRPFGLGAAVLLRFVREGINSLLPLTQVGGDIISARLLTFWGVPGALGAATLIVDVLMQAATQFAFAALGIMTLIALGTDATVAGAAATSLAVAAPLLGGFYFAQRRVGYRILQFVLRQINGDDNWRLLGTVDAVYQHLSTIYARRSGLTASGFVHMTGWLAGVAEVLIVLRCMGLPASVGEALVIESLIQAVRGAAFAVPSALGAQEAGLILLCGIFQIPSDQALALSFIKRAADLAIGVPGLIALQILEGRRVTARYFRRAGQPHLSLDLKSD